MAIDQVVSVSAAACHFDATIMSDEELLIEYRRTGDQSVFSELVRRYERELYVFLCRRFKDETLAEDAVQMTFLRTHLNCERFQEGRRVRPWLYTIATNAGIDILRRRRHRASLSLHAPMGHPDGDATTMLDTLPDDEPLPSECLMNHERNAGCREAVMQLPEKLQLVIELFYFRGLKYREVAEILSVPVGTVKSRIHDAVARLRVIWSQGSEECREALSVT